MAIISARIDNRLLHGIVASQWAPFLSAERVMVISDHIANNPILKSGMQLGKPAGTALSIINEETAYTNFANHKYDGQKVFVIVDNPSILLHLMRQGEEIKQIVLGGTVAPEDGAEATEVSKRAFVRRDEEDIYRQIAAEGGKIIVQYVPKDREQPLEHFIQL